MTRVLFFVPESYAFAIFRPLAEEAERRGYELARFVAGCADQGLTGSDQRLSSVKAVRNWKPDVVFSATHWVPPMFPGTKVMVFHGFGINKRGGAPEKNSHFRIRGYYDLYCTMAEADTRRFEAEAHRHGNFRVVKTGWPRLDGVLAFRGARRPELESGRPVLFYASTFTPELSSAPLVLETLRGLAESGQWEIVATLHPKTDPELLESYRALNELPGTHFIEPGRDLAPWMASADVALTDSSSIIYELMFLDVPVVTLNTTMPGRHLIDVSTPEAIPQALEHARQRPPELTAAMEKATREVHEFTDGQSSARVLDAVAWFWESGSEGLRKRRLGIGRYLNAMIKLRAKMRES